MPVLHLDLIYLFVFVALEVLPAEMCCFKLQTRTHWPFMLRAQIVVFHKEIFIERGKERIHKKCLAVIPSIKM